MINREYLDKINFMVIFALSLTVWSTSFMPGFFIMMLRRNPSQELRNSEENWGRNTLFISRHIFWILETKHCNMVKFFVAPIDNNVVTTETATGYPSATPCRVLKVYHLSINIHFHSEKPILIVLLKTKLVNDYIQISIE